MSTICSNLVNEGGGIPQYPQNLVNVVYKQPLTEYTAILKYLIHSGTSTKRVKSLETSIFKRGSLERNILNFIKACIFHCQIRIHNQKSKLSSQNRYEVVFRQ